MFHRVATFLQGHHTWWLLNMRHVFIIYSVKTVPSVLFYHSVYHILIFPSIWYICHIKNYHICFEKSPTYLGQCSNHISIQILFALDSSKESISVCLLVVGVGANRSMWEIQTAWQSDPAKLFPILLSQLIWPTSCLWKFTVNQNRSNL